MSRSWCTILVMTVCWLNDPLCGCAETSFTSPRTSSVTERKIHEEALYLKEETVSIASRYEQPISRAPSGVYVITDEDIKTSGATDIPTLLRQAPGVEVMQTNAVDFNVSVRGNNQLAAKEGLIYSPLVMCYEECSTEQETHPCTNRPLQKSHSSNIANPPAESDSSTK